jgi:hypothetical protein
MRLKAALNRDRNVYSGEGVVGHERPTWYEIGKVTVNSGSLCIVDLGTIPSGDDGVRIKVPNGSYLIEARLIDFDGSFCLFRARARLVGSTPTLGARAGEVGVDFACVAIGDFDAIEAGINDDDRSELSNLSLDLMETVGEVVRHACSTKSIRFAVCKSGVGDGTYTVFQLRSGRKIVGLEAEFLRDGHVLP